MNQHPEQLGHAGAGGWSVVVAVGDSVDHTVPSFWLGVRCVGGELREIAFLAAEVAPVEAIDRASAALAAEAARQLAAWLDDPTTRFELPLATAGTPFQRRVWAAIAAIPCGETRSYGELARELGSSARAVGGACGANPLPIIVPCHRVIAANGRLGGFAHSDGGFLPKVKRWLLHHERCHA